MLQTKILKAQNEQDIITVISLIKDGQLVAIPTETVYGLAADAKNVDAVKKIFIAKNRPSNHPLIVHIASFEKLSDWAKDIPVIAKTLADNFWPGPLTLVLSKRDFVDDIITGGLPTVALRVPANHTLLKILTDLDTGLAAPSANMHKKISPTTSQHVMQGLSGRIAAILDSDSCQVGIESTILDITQSVPKILRHGPITKAMIEEVLQISIDAPDEHSEKISGNMKQHYQPNTKSRLMSLNEIQKTISLQKNSDKLFGVMHYSDLKYDNKNLVVKKMPKDKSDYASCMYDALHYLDTMNVDTILIESIQQQDDWKDVLDRLKKATADTTDNM